MDLDETALFEKVRSTPSSGPDRLDEQRGAQRAFDEVLSKLGERAVAPKDGEAHEHYLAVLGTQAARFGPEERRKINRLGVNGAALAEIVRQDLEFARQEIETPNHSLRPDELRAVEKIDRSGRAITEFYSKRGPSIWMDEFKGDTIRMVSGGSAGILTDEHRGSGWHDFTKANLPEVREIARIMAYQDSAEYKIAKAYRDAGKELPAPHQ